MENKIKEAEILSLLKRLHHLICCYITIYLVLKSICKIWKIDFVEYFELIFNWLRAEPQPYDNIIYIAFTIEGGGAAPCSLNSALFVMAKAWLCLAYSSGAIAVACPDALLTKYLYKINVLTYRQCLWQNISNYKFKCHKGLLKRSITLNIFLL